MATLTADGNTGAHYIKSDTGEVIHGSGDFGGGSFAIQRYFQETQTWVGILDGDGVAVSFTAPFDAIIELPRGTDIRGVLTGSTGPALFWQFG